MLKQPLLNPYNLGQPAPRPLRINVLYCAIASCVVATMGLCFAIIFWQASSRAITKSITDAAAKLRRCARWGEMERKSEFLKATEKTSGSSHRRPSRIGRKGRARATRVGTMGVAKGCKAPTVAKPLDI